MESPIDLFIQDAVKEKQPATVEQLVQLVQEKFNIPKEEALNHIVNLNVHGKLNFKDQLVLPRQRASPFSLNKMWYWITIALTLAALASMFIIPENAFPLVYLRYLFGSVFLLFLPGFCLIKALFPRKELDEIETAGLSVGVSLAMVPLISFLLDLTPWGITLVPLTISFVALTVVFATVAVFRNR
jgi:hypothetical protein